MIAGLGPPEGSCLAAAAKCLALFCAAVLFVQLQGFRGGRGVGQLSLDVKGEG